VGPDGHRPEDRSRFDLILLLRLRLGRLGLSGAEAPLAADGIVGFSAICTHAGCVVSGWKSAEGQLYCPCHGSVYDPSAGGRVVAGPAPRPLPALPLRPAEGALTVIGGFTARIGGGTGRTD
jgi:rieske iron-sulfur protein